MTPSRLVCLLVALPGLFIALCTFFGVDLAGPFGFLDPGVGFHTNDVGSRLGFGIAGGVMVGWGLTLDAMLAGHSVRTTLLRGAFGWFALDSAVSVASGMWPNVLFNLVFLVALVGLAFSRVGDVRPTPLSATGAR
jgi:hypothetical protein